MGQSHPWFSGRIFFKNWKRLKLVAGQFFLRLHKAENYRHIGLQKQDKLFRFEIRRTANLCINQSIDQSINKSINQSISRSSSRFEARTSVDQILFWLILGFPPVWCTWKKVNCADCAVAVVHSAIMRCKCQSTLESAVLLTPVVKTNRFKDSVAKTEENLAAISNPWSLFFKSRSLKLYLKKERVRQSA